MVTCIWNKGQLSIKNGSVHPPDDLKVVVTAGDSNSSNTNNSIGRNNPKKHQSHKRKCLELSYVFVQ